MQYRLISLDLDGTLLDNDKLISDRNAQALERASGLGARVVITTGRILPEALRLTEKLRTISAIASSNGAYIVGSDGESVFFEKAISQTAIEEVTAALDDSGVFYCAYGRDAIYIKRGVMEKLKDIIPSGEGKFCDVVLVDSFQSGFGDAAKPVYKINVFDRNIEALRTLRGIFGARKDVELSSSAPPNIEVTAGGVHKGAALRFLGKMWDLDSNQMAAFGDGENDIPMFRQAGISFAMGNAPHAIKSVASRVTGTNQEDGVAAAVEEWLLQAAASLD